MIREQLRLDGKVAIVTGAGRGIGRAIARALAEFGADIGMCARTREELEDAAGELRSLGRRVVPQQADVTRRDEVERMVEGVCRELGRVDILVNNVGIAIVKPFLDQTPEDWQAQIAPNLLGMFHCTQIVGRLLVAQRSGKVINVSSVAGVAGKSGMTLYGATKAGVIQFTRALAIEWAPWNVQVNCIVPGAFYTRPMVPVLEDPTIGPIRIKKIPLRRAGSPEELGALAVFLASRASDFATGAAFTVDGGETAKL
jgi:NAD(P)-dependent dehydrogenase (short-subunit alcohol dehydrogenase family)